MKNRRLRQSITPKAFCVGSTNPPTRSLSTERNPLKSVKWFLLTTRFGQHQTRTDNKWSELDTRKSSTEIPVLVSILCFQLRLKRAENFFLLIALSLANQSDSQLSQIPADSECKQLNTLKDYFLLLRKHLNSKIRRSHSEKCLIYLPEDFPPRCSLCTRPDSTSVAVFPLLVL